MKTQKQKDIFFAIPFFLILIFGILMGYFSFVSALNKTQTITAKEILRNTNEIPPSDM